MYNHMLVHYACVFYSLIGGPVRAAFLGLTARRLLRPAWALAVLIGAAVLMPPLAGDVAAQDADKTPIGIEFSPESLEVREGNSITVTVSVPAGTNGSVSYRTKGNDTATAGDDYESIQGTLYLGTGADGNGNARSLSHTFKIQTIWDLVQEPSTSPEVFILEFFDVEGELELPVRLKSNIIRITHRPVPITVNYKAETGLANGDYGLELWDDGDTQAEKDRDKVSFRINAPAEAVSTSARSLMSYEISASTDPGKSSAADYTITDKDGAALPASGSLQFPPNTTEQVIWVTPVDDLLVELPETFTLTLSNPQHGVEFPDLDGDGAADATIEVVGTIYSHDDVVEMHVDNVTVTEGKTAKLVATLDRALAEGESARVQVMVSDAGCRRRTTYPQPTPGVDYREVEPTQLIFGAGDQAKTFAIPTFDDFLDEPEECLGVEFGNFRGIKSVSNPTPQKGGQTLELGGFGIWASAFIADNDDPPALFVSPGEVGEPDDGETATLQYRVQLSNPSARTITVDYAEDSGSGQKDPATSGTDYTALTAGTLTFLPGEFRKTVDIEVTGDYDEEPDETVTVQFSDPVNACFPGAGNCPSGPITSTGIIHNDDQNLELSFTLDDPTIVEGEDAVLRLTISHPIGYDVMAGVSTVDGTAMAGSDFKAAGRMGYSVRVPKGSTEATLSVPVLADSVSGEGIEKFSFKLDTLLLFPEVSPVEETPPAVTDQQKLKEIFGSGFAVADIRTNSPMPTASIVDGPALSVAAVKNTVTEGWPAQFEVTLDPPATTDVTFTWRTGNGGLDDGGSDAHKAKAGKDYTSTTATPVTIPAGETSVSLPEIPTLQDTVDEMDQQFMVVLESITGAVADEKRGVVTIRDDDSRPWISIADATVEEGGELSFTITLEGTSENEVSVLWVTEDDTATTLEHDYVGVERRRTVTFAPGEQTKTITVQTLEDRVPETVERFKVQLAHVRHAKYRDPTAVGTITDDDLMEISIADAAPVTEGSGAAAEFTVTLTPEQTSPVTIQWQTQDGPGGGFYVAKSGGAAAEGLNDFTAVQSGSLTFAPGETEKTASVTILDDTAYESIERFGVVVSGDETAMVIRNAIAYGEIQDDDAVNLIMHQPLPAVVEEGETYVVLFKLPPRTEDDFWTVGRLGFINCYLDDYSFLGFPHPGTLLSEANVRDFALAHSKDGVSGEGKLDPANAGYYINYPCSGVAKQEGVTAHIFAEYVSTLEEHNFAVFVRIDDDSISEDNEIASMWLIGHGGEFWSTMSPHLLWNGFALTTIIVDNDRPQASVSDVRVGEDAGNAILTISLSQASTKEVRVSYETRDGTAIVGQDYGNQDNTVTFSPGEKTKTISIPINADHLVEPLPETFTVALKDPSEGLLNVHPVGGEATVTITDSTERTMTIPDRVVDEGEDVEILAKFSDPIAYGVGWFNRIALFFRDDGLSHPATANDDYVKFDGNLLSETTLLLDGDNRVAKTLTTNEDSAIETDEDIGIYARFTIPISDGLVYDSSRTSRITIRDDDHASLMIAGLDGVGNVELRAGQVWTAPTPSITGRPLGHVTWTLEGDDADDFSIDPDTGEVTLSDRDFEKPTDKDKNNIYSATVRATDEDGNTDTAAVQVTAGGRSLVLSKNSVTVAEKAGTDSFTVSLDSQPTGDVTVALTTTGETGALTLDQTELTFKPGDWNQAQTVTVTGVDDKVDNADDKREASITLVANGSGFAVTVEYTVAATVTDDDDRGITFSKKALTVAENGGTDSYTIVLDTQPTGDVTVTVRGVNTAPLLSVDTATLVFGPDDWDQPQTVTFTGGNDDLDNLKNPRYVITHGAQHADYEGFAAGSVTVTVTDDDVRGVTISKDAVEVNAGDTAEYTVVLNSQPHTGDGVVTIKLEVNPKARDTTDSQYISPTTLTFNSGNWNTPQTVTITGAKPSNLVFLYEIRHQVSGADYTGVKADAVQVANRDEDHILTGDDLTVKSSSATEGGAVVFTVTRRDDTVPALNWRTEGYQSLILPPLTVADPDSDYTSNYVAGGNIVRFEGKDTVTLSVQTTDDDLDEVNEAFTVGIVSYVDKNQGTEGAESLALNHRYVVIGTIIDDDAAALSVAAPAVDEGEKAQVTISLSNPSINDVTVKWNTAADTRDDARPATAGTDYTAVSPAQTVTIKAGATSTVVEVQTTADTATEGNETFLVQLSSPVNAALPETADTAVVTITDNDGAPTVSVGDAAAVVEGDDPETTVNLSFPVTLSAVSGQKVTVTYTLGGTATADEDYTDPATKSVAIAAGTRTANILIPVKGDVVDELNETVTVTLSGATNATVSSVEGADEGEGTITDDDAAELSVAGGSIAEGGAVSFTIGLDPVSDRTVTVKWSTAADAGGTHPAGAADYTAVSPAATATIAAGASSVVVTVQTTQDSLDEPAETFLLELSEPTNAALASGKDEATGTITDNDGAPTVSVGDAAAVVEGDDPETTVNLSFPVTLSAVSGQKVTVTYTLGGTATADEDYTDPATKSVAIAAGTRTANILIPVKGDVVDELNETVTVTLSGATNAAVSSVEGADEGEGTITDDDAAELSVAGGSIAEGGAVSFTIGLDPVSDRTVTVKWSTAADAGGTHPAGAADYTAVSPAATATIAAGASSVVVTVQTTQDSLDEPAETFLLELSEPTNAALASGKDEATGTITDNDGAPTVSVGDAAAVVEGDDPETTVNLSFPVTLSAVSGQKVTVTYTLGGTATADEDYTDPATKSVAIAAGTRTANILIPVKGDVVDELNETVTVTLSGATNAAVSSVEGADEGEGTISDDDAAELSVADGSAVEGGLVSFTIGLDPVSDRTVTVKWSTAADAGGTHPAGAADYTAVSPAATATIAAGASSVVVTVQTTQDSLDEPAETFLLELSEPTNAALASGKDEATGTITDNDGAPTVSVGDAAAVVEGDDPETTVNLSFPVTLSAVSGQKVTVTYTLGGTATADEDYTDPATKSVAIAAGTRTANILIPVKGDVVDELNETVTVTLSGATNATVSSVEGADEGEGTITDDDAAELSVAGGSIAEGGAVSFTIGLDPVSDRTVTVKWSTAADAGGTHPAGAADYTAVSPAATATIAAGASSVVVTVQTTQDSLDEPAETFLLELSEPTNAALASGKDEATGTITDNDGAPKKAIIVPSPGSLTEVVENVAIAPTMTFTVSLGGTTFSTDQTVTMSVGQDGDPAESGVDYTAVSDWTLTIPAGTNNVQGSFTLDPIDDALDEADETLTLTATLSGVNIPDLTFTITDDDGAPTVSVGDAAAALEGDDPETTVNLSFPVTLSAASGQKVTVTYTLGGTATADEDYTDPATKSVAIAAGTRTANILIPVKGDVVDELNETVTVTLGGAVNASLSSVEGATEGEGTITDDDAAELSVADGSGAEGSAVSFVISLDPVSDREVTVKWSTANDAGGTHPAGATDYTAVSTAQTATIAAGSSSVTVTVQSTQDTLDEPDETFLLELSSPVNATLASGKDEATGTIIDDDNAPEVSITPGSGITEGEAAEFTVTASPVPTAPLLVKVKITASGYFGAATGSRTVTIPTGGSATFTVSTVNDTLDEIDGSITGTLQGGSGYTVSSTQGSATVTVADDDEPVPAEATVSFERASYTFNEDSNSAFIKVIMDRPLTSAIVVQFQANFATDDKATVTVQTTQGTLDKTSEATVSVGNAAAVTEGNDPDTIVDLSFPVTLSAVSGQTVTVTYTLGGTATAGSDYTVPSPLSLSIPAGTRTANIVIPVRGDLVDELNETVTVTLSGVVNATLSTVEGATEAEGTIADDDGDVEIYIADYTRGELGPRDIIFAPGETIREIMLDLVDNDIVEPDETFTISLSVVSGPVATGAPTTVTLTDDDQAVIRIDPHDSAHPLTEQVEEGGQGTIWIQMNKPHQEDVTMDCVVRGTATPGEDYVTLHHRVTIPAGSETLAVTLNTIDDNLVEGMETFIFIIANPIGSGVSIDPEQSEHTVNIMDNDDSPATPEISITAGSGITEGGDAEFTVKASPAPGAALPVKVTVVATSGFGAAGTGQRTVTIPTSGSATFTVSTVNDAVDELDGSITGTLQAGSAYRVSSTQGSATVTVADDDEPVPAEATVSFERASYTLDEDDSVLHIKVLMDKAITSKALIWLRIHSTDSDAGHGEDAYIYPSDQYFNFAPGETSREVAVYPVDNDMVEPEETFTISITVVSGPVDTGPPTTVTLTDDDAGVIFIDPQNKTRQVEEGERGIIGIYMSKENKEDVTVDLVVGGTATSGEDYVALPRRTTIPAGATYLNVSVDTIDDDLGEGMETIEFSLANPVGNSVSLEPNLSDHTMKILDNDPFAPEASVVALTDSIIEGEVAYFKITLDPAPIVSFPVSITTVHSNNYETRTSSKIVDVPASGVVRYEWQPWDDDDHETGETLEMRLNPDATYTVSSTQGSATVNMVDNDLPKPVVSITGGGDITEGGDATFTIAASPAHPDAPSGDLSVNLSITVIGAYEITTESETVTVSPGGSVTLTIATTDDATEEADGEVTATLIWGDGHTVSSAQGSATVNVIDNDWPKQVVSITGGSDIAEGGDAEFTITAGAAHPDAPSADLSVNVSIEVTGDYGVTTESETVTVSPGGSVTLTIATTDDATEEADGEVTATLIWGDGYTVSSTQGSATINVVDDDLPKPVVSITGGSSVTEGAAAEFTITAGAAHPDAPSADLSVNVSIEVTGDYGVTTESETVTVSPGGSATLTIATTGDTLDELDGSITATLESGEGYTVSSTQGSATINVVDDDLPKPVVSITGGSSVTEGAAAEFTITAGAAHPDAPSADLSVNVSIEVAGDYGVATESETVTVSPGGSATLTIATTGDTLDELDGSITASLETGEGYTVSSTQGSATVNVVDDDASPTVSVEDASGFEDSFLEFRVTLSEVSGREVQVSWYTLPSYEILDNRAHMTDYDAVSGRLVFAPGVTVMTGKVNLRQDTEDEEDEYFTVWLENPEGATIAREKATMTIMDPN